MLIAVNGTLMQGLSANPILIAAGAKFVRGARTAPRYRLWNVDDQHPAMARDDQSGAAISLELWEIAAENMIRVLEQEPPGLVIGRIMLEDGSTVMGILAEPYCLVNREEITQYRGWREYLHARKSKGG